MTRRLALYLTTLALISGLAHAQNTVADTEAKLKGKTVYLMGGWGQNKLKFDGDGKPEKDYGVQPFTTSGFEERSVSFKGDTLKITGKRIGLRFDASGKMSRSELGGMNIAIKGSAGTDFSKVVDLIFVPSLAALVPSLPSYWRTYGKQHFLEPPSGVADKNAPAGIVDSAHVGNVQHVGGSVTRPKVLSSPDASFSEAARAAKFSGKVEVYLWVDEDGMPSHIRIVRPAGLGLDEEAIAAVAQYRFVPATKDGKPVKVDLYIDVAFSIF